jgi:hypothetical protein
MDREHNDQLRAAGMHQFVAKTCSKHLLTEWGFRLGLCERNGVRGAELGHLITDIMTDHQDLGKNCAIHAVGNAMRSSEATTAQLCQQVTDEGGFVASTEALAVALRSAGQGRSSQLVKAKNILANMPSDKNAALLDGLTGGRARLDYVGTAHVDWNTMIDNCFGLLCTSKKHVFLIKRDLLFDNKALQTQRARTCGLL